MRKWVLFALTIASAKSFALANTGCGPATLIIKDDTSVFGFTCASTTNYSSSPHTKILAITSGTSQCKTGGFVQVEKEKIFFVERNFHSLSLELAKGEGESLNMLSHLYGCNSATTLTLELRPHYEQLFHEGQTAVQFTNDIQHQINTNPNLKQICVGA